MSNTKYQTKPKQILKVFQICIPNTAQLCQHHIIKSVRHQHADWLRGCQ